MQMPPLSQEPTAVTLENCLNQSYGNINNMTECVDNRTILRQGYYVWRLTAATAAADRASLLCKNIAVPWEVVRNSCSVSSRDASSRFSNLHGDIKVMQTYFYLIRSYDLVETEDKMLTTLTLGPR